MGPFSYVDRHLERFEKEGRDHDSSSRVAVERLDLRIGPEAATGQVDGCHLTLQDRSCQIGIGAPWNDNRGGRPDGTDGSLDKCSGFSGRGTRHRDVPPEVTTGVVVVVLGCEVVVVVVVVETEFEADEPEVLAVFFPDASEAALAPGCSLETTRPINAAAAAAARMAVRVNRRRSEWARRRPSGDWSMGCFMSHDGLLEPACTH